MNRLQISSVALCLVCFCGDGLTAAERPNIVLVMCDDLGYGDLGCFDPNSPIATPHLDAMAAAGLKFTRFYAAAPVCSPTRGSCLTGRHPYRYGVYFANTGHMKAEEITLPEILRQHGYTTGHFGKWHLGTLTKDIEDANRGGPGGAEHYAVPAQHGYDQSFVTESKVPTHDPMIRPKGAGNQAWDSIRDKSTAKDYGTRYWAHDGSIVTENLDGDDARVIMDRAIPFIENAAAADTPFFAAIWFHAPHLPVVAGPKHVQQYAGFDVYKRNYYGCVTALDEQIGRLRSTLLQLGLRDNTMLWFCSDNGPEGQSGKAPGAAGNLRGRKRSLYEGGIRVPGLLEWPGHAQPGSKTIFPAVTSDYLPTVLAALDISCPANRPLDGVSLLPAIHDRKTRRGTAIGFQSARQVAWSTDQFKLYSSDQGHTWELYDLVSDPGEVSDVAAVHQDIVRELKSAATAWQASCKRSDTGADY